MIGKAEDIRRFSERGGRFEVAGAERVVRPFACPPWAAYGGALRETDEV